MAIGQLAEIQKKAIEKASKKKEESGEIFILEGDKIVHYP